MKAERDDKVKTLSAELVDGTNLLPKEKLNRLMLYTKKAAVKEKLALYEGYDTSREMMPSYLM